VRTDRVVRPAHVGVRVQAVGAAEGRLRHDDLGAEAGQDQGGYDGEMRRQQLERMVALIGEPVDLLGTVMHGVYGPEEAHVKDAVLPVGEEVREVRQLVAELPVLGVERLAALPHPGLEPRLDVAHVLHEEHALGQPALHLVADLLEEIYRQKPGLRSHDPTILIGAGVEFVDRSHVIQPGETIAIMPPVQGG